MSPVSALPQSSLETNAIGTQEARALVQRMDDLGRLILQTYDDGLGRQASEEFLSALNDLRSNYLAFSSALEAASAAASLQEAAGEVAESELAEEFSKLSDIEERAAKSWTTGTIGALVASAVVAYFSLRDAATLTLSEELTRLTVTLPIAAISAYCARIAAQHRKNGHWARITAVQLKSVRAYGEDLNEASRDEVRRRLAETAFGRPPIFDGKSLEPNPTDEVNALLDRALAIVRSAKV